MKYQINLREFLDLIYDARHGLESSITNPQPESSEIVKRIEKLSELTKLLEKWDIKEIVVTRG